MSALSDVENLRLHDISDGDVRDDPRWLDLMGENAVKAFLADMARKHLPGQLPQDSHGHDHGGIDVPNPLDKLKLGKRAPAGFRVRSSKKIKTDYADVGIAEVDSPDGPQVRVGVIGNESGKWDAGFVGEARKAELRKQIAEKRTLFDSDSDDVDDDIEDQISELESELEDLEGERTAIVSPEQMADFRRQLGEGLEVAKANKAKVDADMKVSEAIDEKRDAIIAEHSDPGLEKKVRELSWRLRQAQGIVRELENDLTSGRSRHGWDPEFTAERLASWKENVVKYEAELAPLLARRAELMPPDARARLEDLDRQFNAINDAAIDDMLTAAEVSAPNGARIRAEIWGSDDEDEQWVSTRLYVLTPGETSDDIDDDYGSFRGLKGLNKLIAGLESSGDLPKSSRRDTQNKHLPGRHDQSSHGRGRRRTPDVDVPDVPKPEPVAEPKPPKPRRAPKPKPPSDAPKPKPPRRSPAPAAPAEPKPSAGATSRDRGVAAGLRRAADDVNELPPLGGRSPQRARQIANGALDDVDDLGRADLAPDVEALRAELPGLQPAQIRERLRQLAERVTSKPKPDTPNPSASGSPDVRSVLRNAKTAKEISAAAQKESERITDAGVFFNLDGADPQVARELAEGVLRGLERFPNADLSRVRVSTTMANQHRVMAKVDGDEILIGADWAADPQRYRDTLSHYHTEGHLVGDSPMATAIHEFGHVVAMTGDSERSAGKLLLTTAKSRSIEGEEDVRVFVESQISTWAAADNLELTAEAFADVMLNGDKASDLSKTIFKHLEDQYRRAVG